jgi:integrase
MEQHKWAKSSEAQYSKYVKFCEEHGLNPIPPSLLSIAGYLTDFSRRNKGSTKSLSNVKSQLKTRLAMRGIGWLSQGEEAQLRALIAEMRLADSTVVNRKLPLTLDLIERIIVELDLGFDPQLLLATILATGHDGLFRLGELCSGIRASEVTWWVHRKGFTVSLFRTKTHRSSGAIGVDVGDHASPFSAVKLLRLWWDHRGLDKRPDAFVFPSIKRRNVCEEAGSVTADWVRKIIKESVASLGLDPARFSGHSLRAGGATDLFVARVPYFLIKKMGRWKSDAAMLYYRSEDDVNAAVQAAFSSLSVLGNK